MPSLDFEAHSYDIQRSDRGIEIRQQRTKQPIDATIAALHTRIYSPFHSNKGALPQSVRHLKGSSGANSNETAQLLNYAKVLSDYLQTHNLLAQKQLVEQDIRDLKLLKKTDFTLQELEQLGQRLISLPVKERDAPGGLPLQLKELFLRELEALSVSSDGDVRLVKALATMAVQLGQDYVGVTVPHDKKNYFILRSDLPPLMKKLGQLFPATKAQYTTKELLQLADLLTNVPKGIITAYPLLNEYKNRLLAELPAAIFTENPTELKQLLQQLGHDYTVTGQQGRYQLIDRFKTTLAEVHAFAENPAGNYSTAELEKLVDHLFNIPAGIAQSDAKVAQAKEHLQTALLHRALFNSEELDANFMQLLKKAKQLLPDFHSLDCMVQLPSDEERAKQLAELQTLQLEKGREFYVMHLTHNTHDTTGAAALLHTAADNQWILWIDRQTKQVFLSCKKANGIEHNPLPIVANDTSDVTKWSIWALHHLLGSQLNLRPKDMIGNLSRKMEELASGKLDLPFHQAIELLQILQAIPKESLDGHPAIENCMRRINAALDKIVLFTPQMGSFEYNQLIAAIKTARSIAPQLFPTRLEPLILAHNNGPVADPKATETLRAQIKVAALNENRAFFQLSMAREVGDKQQAQQLLENSPPDNWVIWTDEQTKQVYISAKKATTVRHYPIPNALFDAEPTNQWHIRQSIQFLQHILKLPENGLRGGTLNSLDLFTSSLSRYSIDETMQLLYVLKLIPKEIRDSNSKLIESLSLAAQELIRKAVFTQQMSREQLKQLTDGLQTVKAFDPTLLPAEMVPLIPTDDNTPIDLIAMQRFKKTLQDQGKGISDLVVERIKSKSAAAVLLQRTDPGTWCVWADASGQFFVSIQEGEEAAHYPLLGVISGHTDGSSEWSLAYAIRQMVDNRRIDSDKAMRSDS